MAGGIDDGQFAVGDLIAHVFADRGWCEHISGALEDQAGRGQLGECGADVAEKRGPSRSA